LTPSYGLGKAVGRPLYGNARSSVTALPQTLPNFLLINRARPDHLPHRLATFRPDSDLNPREIPIAFQLPDWNHWFHVFMPLDFRESIFKSSAFSQPGPERIDERIFQ
jgi:hypothetical protein